MTLVWAGIFLLLGATLGALLATQSVPRFLELSTVATVALLAAGAVGCALWFRIVLRRSVSGCASCPPPDRNELPAWGYGLVNGRAS